MKPFTKQELKAVGIILLAIVLASAYNFRISIRRARDAQRRSDIGAIAGALNRYQQDFGSFPLASSDGEIRACAGEGFNAGEVKKMLETEKALDFYELLAACEWGKDALADVLDPGYPPYLKVIPGDPRRGQGISYLYLSNGNRYQLYAYLEGGKSEVEFREGIVVRKIACGSKICNFGRAYSKTPLEKSIEEYENELIEESK